jgi:hypothetical protein
VTEQNLQTTAQAEKLLKTLPADCAAEIIHGLLKGRKRIVTGTKSSTIFWMARLLPISYPRLLRMLG